MATDSIISDSSAIYKRLFNHRPILQNEVHLFIEKFETARGDEDMKVLKNTMKKANEVDAVFLEEMKQSFPLFEQLKAKITAVCERGLCIVERPPIQYSVKEEEQEAMANDIATLKAKLSEEKEQFDKEMEQKMEALKAEAELHREQRKRLRPIKLASPDSSISE